MIKALAVLIRGKKIFGEKEIKYLIQKEYARYQKIDAPLADTLCNTAILSDLVKNQSTNNLNIEKRGSKQGHDQNATNLNQGAINLDQGATTSGLKKDGVNKVKKQTENSPQNNSMKVGSEFAIMDLKTIAIEKTGDDTNAVSNQKNKTEKQELTKYVAPKYYTGNVLNKGQAPVEKQENFSLTAQDLIKKNTIDRNKFFCFPVDNQGKNSNLILKNLGGLDAITQVDNPNNQNALPRSFERN